MNANGFQRYIIAAANLAEAEQIAQDNGLRRREWTYAYCGYPTRQLRDGLRVDSEDRLLGDFKPEERWLLTAHLDKGRTHDV